MNPSTLLNTLAAVLACLTLIACREQRQEPPVSDPAATASTTDSSTESAPDPQQESILKEITDLRNEMQRRESMIGDLEAAVLMERAKIDENPDHDTSFLSEILHEQEQERLKIERARKRIEALTAPAD